MSVEKETWSSHWGFMLATAGSAIGLGNIWKFPYITGENGGGAFVLIYLIAIMLVGFPMMLCELAVGRATGLNPVGAFLKLSPKRSLLAEILGGFLIVIALSLACFHCYGFAILIGILGILILIFGWTCLGIMVGLIIPCTILAYYGVIGGWTVIYIFKAFSQSLNFVTPEGAEQVLQPILTAPHGTWGMLIGAQVLFMMLCSVVLYFGVRKGIERFSKVLMPLLFILLLALILRSISLPDAGKGIRFFLAPDFSKLSTAAVLVALGHAFFTLSLAMGITMTYGSYLNKSENLVKSSLIVIGLDTLAAMMAGIAIFPAVFAMGFQPDGGPALVFQILPAAFNQMPGGFGWVWNGLFFFMLFIAALTSSISLIEPPVSILVEQFKMRRRTAITLIVLLVTSLGILCALSMANWDNILPVREAVIRIFGDMNSSLFDMLDSLSCNWLLPLAGLATTIYVGWVWGTRHALNEIRKGMNGNEIDTNLILILAGLKGEPGYGDFKKHILTPASLWAIFVRWITPVLVLFAFLNGLKLI